MAGLFECLSLLEKQLDAKWLRNTVLSNNIANVDTPGYKRYDVSFEKELREALENENKLPITITQKGHLSNIKTFEDVRPVVYVQNDIVLRNDKNNVDIDKEMVEMAENTLSYNITADQIQRIFQLLSTAINGGGR